MTEKPSDPNQTINTAKMRGMKKAQALARNLVNEYADTLLDLYNSGLGYTAITRTLPEELTRTNFSVAEAAVKFAIRAITTPKERAEKKEINYTNAVKRLKDSGHYEMLGRIGAQARIAQLTEQEKTELSYKSVRKRGLTPWTDDEKNFALSHMEDYRSKFGIHYEGLAEQLNRLFHEGKQVRGSGIRNSIQYFKQKSDN